MNVIYIMSNLFVIIYYVFIKNIVYTDIIYNDEKYKSNEYISTNVNEKFVVQIKVLSIFLSAFIVRFICMYTNSMNTFISMYIKILKYIHSQYQVIQYKFNQTYLKV